MSGRRMLVTAALTMAVAVAAPAVALDLAGSGFAAPLFLGAPAGDPRLFVVEQGGVIKVGAGGVWSTFLDISALGERRRRARAARPRLRSQLRPTRATGYVYVYYTRPRTANRNSVVARYQASAANPNVADPASAHPDPDHRPAGRTDQPQGGMDRLPPRANRTTSTSPRVMAAAANAPGQLRAESSHSPPRQDPPPGRQRETVTTRYAAGNPFAVATTNNDAIWAYGLRNPFRYTFDRVHRRPLHRRRGPRHARGSELRNSTIAGPKLRLAPCSEGQRRQPGRGLPAACRRGRSRLRLCLAQHHVLPRTSASITGGYVYRGNAIPQIDGTYFFADLRVGPAVFVPLRQRHGRRFRPSGTAEFGMPFGARGTGLVRRGRVRRSLRHGAGRQPLPDRRRRARAVDLRALRARLPDRRGRRAPTDSRHRRMSRPGRATDGSRVRSARVVR